MVPDVSMQHGLKTRLVVEAEIDVDGWVMTTAYGVFSIIEGCIPER
jgi:hypothetical protein